ncbi:MAG: hypothetical protein BVN35_16295 [Proteobacteria bacterium ST_bin11]|nr:MAG: hypothetical protein BVN35_16295 [Proteobacteria bacterium ST_bin11]
MKSTIFLALVLIAEPVFAVTKCIVDGKTVYQQGRCMKGEEKPISVKSVSILGTSGLRDEIERDNVEYVEQLKRDAKMRPNSSTDFADYGAIKQRRVDAQEKLKEMGLRDKQDDILEKLETIDRKASAAAANSANTANRQKPVGWVPMQ